MPSAAKPSPPPPKRAARSKPAPEPPVKRGRGRPKGVGAFRPTQEQRDLVEAMAAFGIPEEDMVTLIRNPKTGKHIAINTLRKHFHGEQARGLAQANVKVAGALFKAATVQGNVTAQIFWLKARAGYREKVDVTAPADTSGARIQDTDTDSLLDAARRVAFTMALGAHAIKK